MRQTSERGVSELVCGIIVSDVRSEHVDILAMSEIARSRWSALLLLLFCTLSLLALFNVLTLLTMYYRGVEIGGALTLTV